MATSPGARGGMSVLSTAVAAFPRFGANIIAEFSLPSFQDNFKEEGITNAEYNNDLNSKLKSFQAAL